MPLLVPIDTLVPSRRAVDLAALIGERLSTEVIVLHVSPRSPPLERLAELHAISSPIRERGVAVRLRTVRGPVVERILDIARQRRCSWILMGTSGQAFRGGRGSTARGVMAQSDIPVIAVRPGEPPEAPTGRIATICAPDHAEARLVASLLATASGAVSVSARPEPGPDGSITISPLSPGGPRGHDLLVTSFDPACEHGDLCGRVLAEERGTVVVVSNGRCGCAALAAR